MAHAGMVAVTVIAAAHAQGAAEAEIKRARRIAGGKGVETVTGTIVVAGQTILVRNTEIAETEQLTLDRAVGVVKHGDLPRTQQVVLPTRDQR